MTKNFEFLNRIKEELNGNVALRDSVFKMFRIIEQNAYDKGFEDALTNFAHMKDGVFYIGTTGKTLESAIAERRKMMMYSPESVDWTKDHEN